MIKCSADYSRNSDQYFIIDELIGGGMSFHYILMFILALGIANVLSDHAQAKSCNPANKQELIALLAKYSPFKGNWKLVRGGKTWSGPINIRTTKYGDVLRVQSSGADKKLNEPGLVEVKFTSARNFTFNKNGKYRLTLKPDCSLTGTQAHRSGRVDIALK